MIGLKPSMLVLFWAFAITLSGSLVTSAVFFVAVDVVVGFEVPAADVVANADDGCCWV